jgi:hypothetical protein
LIDAQTKDRWRDLEPDTRELPAQQRLKAFFHTALARASLRLLIIRRFDKLFMNMSSALLAVLRDLEHTGRLTAINTSVLSYNELYRRRARRDPTFVSDYGQSHTSLMLGPLDDDEAQKEWSESVDRSIEPSLERAYYSVALDASGRVPTLLSKAAAYVDAMKGSDLRSYQRLLDKELAPGFCRLLRYDDDDDSGSPALAESIAHIHWRMASTSDVDLVSGHRWGELLLMDLDGERTLVSHALGACAVDLLRHTTKHVSAEVLYQRGEYRACVDQLGDSADATRSPLAIAAHMLSLAFSDATAPLYFVADLDWGRVETYADEGARACSDPAAVDEFRQWERVARAMKRHNGDSRIVLEHDLVRIGLRVLAVRADRNAVAAAYSAIPLVEDALRTYVVRIHDASSTGSAFADVSDKEIARWWNRAGFTRPSAASALNGASLVVLAAVLSDRSAMPLFADAADAMLLVKRLDQLRNVLGHRVHTPDWTYSRELADRAERILDSTAEQGGADLSVRRLSIYVAPPQAFLFGR